MDIQQYTELQKELQSSQYDDTDPKIEAIGKVFLDLIITKIVNIDLDPSRYDEIAIKQNIVKFIDKQIIGFSLPGYVLWNFGYKYIHKKLNNIEKLQKQFRHIIEGNFKKLQNSNNVSRSRQSDISSTLNLSNQTSSEVKYSGVKNIGVKSSGQQSFQKQSFQKQNFQKKSTPDWNATQDSQIDISQILHLPNDSFADLPEQSILLALQNLSFEKKPSEYAGNLHQYINSLNNVNTELNQLNQLMKFKSKDDFRDQVGSKFQYTLKIIINNHFTNNKDCLIISKGLGGNTKQAKTQATKNALFKIYSQLPMLLQAYIKIKKQKNIKT